MCPAETAVGILYVKQYHLTVASAYGGPTGTGWYDSGATVNLAVSSPVLGNAGVQYIFTMWTGDSSSTSPSTSIIMNGVKSVTANWQTQYQVAFTVAPSEGGTTSPAGTIWVNAGGDLSISATAANTNYKFSSWTNTAGTTIGSTSASTVATITGAGTVTANFEQIQTQTPTPTPTPSPTPAPTANPLQLRLL